MTRAARAVACATLVAVSACGLIGRHRDDDRSPPIDLNSASVRKVEQLPGVTPSMARRIVEGRPYDDPHDLVERGILTERELGRILDRVSVKARGD
jgi:predicted DNA-binding helix-hairpin-helix protein